MEHIFGRIILEKTNYTTLSSAKMLVDPNYEELEHIYLQYCKYKKFKSFLPFFVESYQTNNRDIIGYYDRDTLVAYSLLLKYPSRNSVMAEQFAWNYKNPKLRLGIKSLEHECETYRRLGYKYLYLGEHQDYKSSFLGYELV